MVLEKCAVGFSITLRATTLALDLALETTLALDLNLRPSEQVSPKTACALPSQARAKSIARTRAHYITHCKEVPRGFTLEAAVPCHLYRDPSHREA